MFSKRLILLFVVGCFAISFSSLTTNGAVRSLDKDELAKIVGGSNDLDCKPKGNACQDKAVGCAIPGRECSLHCEHRYQNWACESRDDFSCRPKEDRDCKRQDTGYCDAERKCETDDSAWCGKAKDCERF